MEPCTCQKEVRVEVVSRLNSVIAEFGSAEVSIGLFALLVGIPTTEVEQTVSALNRLGYNVQLDNPIVRLSSKS